MSTHLLGVDSRLLLSEDALGLTTRLLRLLQPLLIPARRSCALDVLRVKDPHEVCCKAE